MKYSKQFYKDIEQLSYYVYKENKYDKPSGWKRIKVYENKKNGFYSEVFENIDGKKVLICRGTDTNNGINEMKKDLNADLKLGMSQIPQQAYDAYLAYEDIANKYDNVIIAGYSLGGSLTQIVCNETGAEGITFEAYGVGDIVKPKHTTQITNFGNENDPIFRFSLEKQFGTNYIIPDSGTPLNSGISISKHMPNQIGDVTKAIAQKDLYVKAQQNQYIINNYIKNPINENILTPFNRVFYENEIKIKDMDEKTLKQFVNQYYDNNYKFPQKSELDLRSNLGELIYVDNYKRSDGTMVKGYYRRYPNK